MFPIHKPLLAPALLMLAVLLVVPACGDDEDAEPGVPTGATGTAEAADEDGDGVTLDEVQSFIVASVTDVESEDVTAVEFEDGLLTVETVWDDTRQADAEGLCDELLTMTTDPPVESVTIDAADGTSLAECEGA